MYVRDLKRILKKFLKKSNFVILIPFSGKNKYCRKSLKCIYLLKRFQQFNFCYPCMYPKYVYFIYSHYLFSLSCYICYIISFFLFIKKFLYHYQQKFFRKLRNIAPESLKMKWNVCVCVEI